MKNGIVILNYLNNEVTQETLKSLLKQDGIADFEVLIVDNGSPDAVYGVLSDFIEDLNKDFVHLIRTSVNIGFARGHNFGIKHLRKLGIRNVLLMNSDIAFVESNGLQRLFAPNALQDYAVVGPNILANDGKASSPIFQNITVFSTLIRLIANSSKQIRSSALFNNKKNAITSTVKSISVSSNISTEDKMFFLHGAAFVLTEKYFEIYPGLYPKTFLYYEGQILQILIKKSGLRMRYIPSVHMSHVEDQSSALSYGNKADKKAVMVARSQFQALKAYFMTVGQIGRVIKNDD